jgi:putative addiction module CopG family antidote
MKVSVSIPDDDAAYLDSQVTGGRFSSRSAAVHAAIKSLRSRDLEAQYAEAFRDWHDSGEQAVWDTAIADGLDDEAW